MGGPEYDKSESPGEAKAMPSLSMRVLLPAVPKKNTASRVTAANADYVTTAEFTEQQRHKRRKAHNCSNDGAGAGEGGRSGASGGVVGA